MTPSLAFSARRAAVVLAVAAVTLVSSATPALASVPVGWSDPEPVNMVHALLWLGLVPLSLFILITALVYLPALIRGERVAPGAHAVEPQWLGGPRRGTAELSSPDSVDSQAGGASGRW